MADEIETIRSALADRYDVERELGRGGMAVVYLARDRKHDRQVAIKVFRDEFAAAVGHDRFLREIKTTAQLTHAHILPLLDSGESKGVLFYVMPFIDGESLEARLQRQAQLPIPDVVGITSDVASALSYAHTQGVIHRDIKPANIMLSGGEAIVMDFGISRAVTSAGAEKLTSTGLTVGTPAYMSPEQSTGSEEVDGRTDVYSLGTVVYEMLAGEPPFSGRTAQAIIAKRLTDEVPRLRTVRDVPEPIELAVRKSLSRAPVDRWNSAADFAAALRGEIATEGFPAHPRRGVRPRTIAIAVAAAALIITAVIVAPKMLGNGTAQTPAFATAPAGMVLVPGGSYRLGGTCAICSGEKTVPLDSFFIDRTEVSVDAFRQQAAVAQLAVPATVPSSGLTPVVAVFWKEADAMCRSRGAALPTEDQWEAAARGTEGHIYPWGNSWDSTRANANNVNKSLRPVGSLASGASPSGAFDMVGNAWEWTSTAAPDSLGRRRFVMRGGGYDTPSNLATAINRVWVFAESADSVRTRNYGKIGFRCAKSLR